MIWGVWKRRFYSSKLAVRTEAGAEILHVSQILDSVSQRAGTSASAGPATVLRHLKVKCSDRGTPIPGQMEPISPQACISTNICTPMREIPFWQCDVRYILVPLISIFPGSGELSVVCLDLFFLISFNVEGNGKETTLWTGFIWNPLVFKRTIQLIHHTCQVLRRVAPAKVCKDRAN